jgi:pyridinium-3,5-bisthiocarboxylic acid mononucleotide nickel chelatase
MSRYLLFDPLGGVSGDMFLSSLLDLGVPLTHIQRECLKLKLKQEYKLVCKNDVNKGFAGKKLYVKIKEGKRWVSPESLNKKISTDKKSKHEHVHDEHGGHHQPHSHKHSHAHGDHHQYKDIRELIKKSKLSNQVIKRSLAVFDKLAVAEAKVHGTKPETVTFHEVGAVDSILDIVGGCIALEYLQIDQIYSTAIAVGSGQVTCAHGVLPLPAPATLECLKGKPILYSGENKEMCTPTGAALLSALCEFKTNSLKNIAPLKTGYGLCHNLPEHSPPYLRVTLLENQKSDNLVEQLLQISFNVDDMAPEYIAPFYDKCLNLGALDVFVTPIVMKKGRLAHEISVLIKPEDEDKITNTIFKETSTFGLKKQWVLRESLKREIQNIKTSLGQVRVKKATSKEYASKYHLEFEDVKLICEKHMMSAKDVISTIEKEIF